MKTEKKYQHINLDYINELADGDGEFVMEVIQTFMTTVPLNLNKLKDASDEKDYTEVAFIAHKLKGSFAFIGCTQLGNTFTLLEKYSVDQEKYEMIPELIIEVTGFYEKIAEELGNVIAAGSDGL